IVMDLDNIEQIDLRALGGVDKITVNDLQGTDLIQANLFLSGTLGGTNGDGSADTVIVNGTNGNDIIDVTGSGTTCNVIGLQTAISIQQSEGANDSLVVNGLGGDDRIT